MVLKYGVISRLHTSTMFNKAHQRMYLTNISHFGLMILPAVIAAMVFGNITIAHDKGKPAVRQGRKAVSLPPKIRVLPENLRKIVWLPKAVGGGGTFNFAPEGDSESRAGFAYVGASVLLPPSLPTSFLHQPDIRIVIPLRRGAVERRDAAGG